VPLAAVGRPGAPQVRPALTLSQAKVVSHLAGAVKALGPPPPAEQRKGFLSRVLRSTDTYDLDRESTRRPYDPEKIRVVRDGQVRPKLVSAVVGPDALFAVNSPLKWVVKQDEDLAKLTADDMVMPYSDPALHDPRVLKDLVRKLYSANVLTFRRKAKNKIGAFTAAKKG
jgi:hypothetical protein